MTERESITSEVMVAMPRAAIIESMVTDRVAQPVGRLLKEWRMRRRLSQLELALEAETSPRHLSFIETGRSTPSREMLLRLAERLDVPLRERNTLLVAAGYAPRFPERRLDDDELAAAQRVVELVLKGHEPFPALAVDRHWNLVARNDAVPPLLVGVDPALLEPPVNVLKLSLHPNGLAPRIVNLAEWREHLLDRLRKQIEATADSVSGRGLAIASSTRRCSEMLRNEPGFGLSIFLHRSAFVRSLQLVVFLAKVRIRFQHAAPREKRVRRSSDGDQLNAQLRIRPLVEESREVCASGRFRIPFEDRCQYVFGSLERILRHSHEDVEVALRYGSANGCAAHVMDLGVRQSCAQHPRHLLVQRLGSREQFVRVREAYDVRRRCHAYAELQHP